MRFIGNAFKYAKQLTDKDPQDITLEDLVVSLFAFIYFPGLTLLSFEAFFRGDLVKFMLGVEYIGYAIFFVIIILAFKAIRQYIQVGKFHRIGTEGVINDKRMAVMDAEIRVLDAQTSAIQEQTRHIWMAKTVQEVSKGILEGKIDQAYDATVQAQNQQQFDEIMERFEKLRADYASLYNRITPPEQGGTDKEETKKKEEEVSTSRSPLETVKEAEVDTTRTQPVENVSSQESVPIESEGTVTTPSSDISVPATDASIGYEKLETPVPDELSTADIQHVLKEYAEESDDELHSPSTDKEKEITATFKVAKKSSEEQKQIEKVEAEIKAIKEEVVEDLSYIPDKLIVDQKPLTDEEKEKAINWINIDEMMSNRVKKGLIDKINDLQKKAEIITNKDDLFEKNGENKDLFDD